MFASDYREKAREALRGKWKRMALLMLLAGLLGATGGVSIDTSGFKVSFGGAQQKEMLYVLAALSVILGAYQLLIGAWTRVGLYSMYNRVLDGDAPRAGMLFPRGIFWKCVGMNLLRSLYVFFWSLLLVVPGILAAYSYSMADYLLSRNPEMGVSEALRESKRLMYGRRWRFFCLEMSFIGWVLLCMVPMSILTAGLMLAFMGAGSAMSTGGAIAWLLLVSVISIVSTVFVDVYSFMAGVVFFRDAERPQEWQQQAQQGWNENEAANGFEAGDFDGDASGEDPDRRVTALTADETVAKDVFMQHGCSRRRMRDEGVLEDYEALHVDSSFELRWLREYANALMLRFSREPEVLDEILELAAEYAMDDLLTRALERIDRHIRQQSLPDGEILNMAGRVLALVVSGTFDEHPEYIQRRKEQVSDMADRLERRLEEHPGDGEWRRGLELVRRMCA